MSLNTQPYKGARDFYPEELRVRNYIFQTWRNVCYKFGYEEYDSPIIEPIELFSAKSGDELVNQQSYSFADRGGREVTLRPEMTPSVSRLVAGRRQELTLPIRWFSIPNCWRYERPQKGRGREFYQLNIDLFGVDNAQAELEMLLMVKSIMEGFGAKPNQYEIRVNSRKAFQLLLGEWLALTEVEQKTITRLIDRMHKMPPAEFEGLIDASMSPSQREQGLASQLIKVLRGSSFNDLPEMIKSSSAVQDIQSILSNAKALGITNITYDISLARGLDYYTDFVFEVFDTNPDNNRSMFGGGRYDGLVGLFGVDPIPTIGFGMGDIVIHEFLKGHGLLPTIHPEAELIIIPIGDTVNQCQTLASTMRDQGVNVSIDLTNRKTDKQLKSAIKTGVNYVLFVGETEVAEGLYRLKNLAKQQEEPKSIERIVSIVKDHRQES
ncbi:histidine--tRNA ligase [Candidatus Saccharibacteria bacterium]|nr:histidine--tRNA ligase [Candidatus Saccharibacteria bacterium]